MNRRSLVVHSPWSHGVEATERVTLSLVLLQTVHYDQSTEGEVGRGVSGSGNSCVRLLTCDFTRRVFTVERGSTHRGSVSIAALDLVPWTRRALASPSGILTHWE